VLPYEAHDGAADTDARRAIEGLAGFFIIVAGFVHFASFLIGFVYVPAWRAMGGKLPAVTALVAACAQWIAFGWGWVALWTAAAAAPMFVGRLRPRWATEGNGAYLLLALAVTLVAGMAFLLLALAAPEVTIGIPVNAAPRPK